jgi:nitrogen fixation NifU-like protein
MSELTDLYQELILDHGRKPRNFREVTDPSHSAEGHNPLCGDRLTLSVRLEEGVIRDVAFLGSGCAISTAAASTMTEAVKGRTLAEAQELFDRFHDLLTGRTTDASSLPPKLAAFKGVAMYPMRVKCATLAWHTLRNALHGSKDPASTE